MGRMQRILACCKLVSSFGFSFRKHGLRLSFLEPEIKREMMGSGGTMTDTTTGVTCTERSPAGDVAGVKAVVKAEA